MNNSAIIMFLFGAIMLWGGSIYFLWKLLKDHKRKIGIKGFDKDSNISFWKH